MFHYRSEARKSIPAHRRCHTPTATMQAMERPRPRNARTSAHRPAPSSGRDSAPDRRVSCRPYAGYRRPSPRWRSPPVSSGTRRSRSACSNEPMKTVISATNPLNPGRAERSETGYHVTNRCEGHDTHQAAHLADVARVGAAVNDAYQRKEQGRHRQRKIGSTAPVMAVRLSIRMAKSTRLQWLTDE